VLTESDVETRYDCNEDTMEGLNRQIDTLRGDMKMVMKENQELKRQMIQVENVRIFTCLLVYFRPF
jgi:hypothetical protein